MTDTRFAGRCDALYREDARPLLAAVAAARVAGRPIPVADWQCSRPPHADTELPLHDQHLAFPLGATGPSFRFGAELVEPDPDAAEPQPAPPAEAHAAHLGELVERLARAGVAAVRCEPGDTLLLIAPDVDPDQPAGAEQLVRDLAEHVPGVAVLVLAGVAAAVVVPAPADPPSNPYGCVPGCLRTAPHPDVVCRTSV